MQEMYEAVLFLGRKSNDSLYQLLRRKGWIYDMNVEWKSMRQVPEMLILTFQLSREGLVNWEQIPITVFDSLTHHLNDNYSVQRILKEGRVIGTLQQSYPTYTDLKFWLRRCANQLRKESVETFPYQSTI
ncbi:hypothetical protein, partial [Candidatus Similichlamydia epinepheli]|uniref:hypothetical protein n=1 Tax=Candidatus Similichlamydia epinepheli TaxID=1903953 RepID=UPI0013001FDA